MGEVLDPFEIGDGHPPCIQIGVGDDDRAFVAQYLIGGEGDRAVGCFGDEGGLDFGGVLAGDDAFHGGGDEDVAIGRGAGITQGQIGQQRRFHTGRILLRLGAIQHHERGAKALDTGEVLVTARLVDPSLQSEGGFQWQDGNAVGLHRAVATAFTHVVVDKGPLGRIRGRVGAGSGRGQAKEGVLQFSDF